MIHATPRLPKDVQRGLDQLDGLRRRLVTESQRPARWMGSLRRFAKAKAIESSTSIEGFALPLEDAVVLVSHEEPPASDVAAEQAIACYAQAMDHVAAMADDPEFEWSQRVILDLHFEACYF